MKVLVACEESQTICRAFRELGHEAYSCDLKDCSGGHPEWHIKEDAIKVAYDKRYKWDFMVAHPPCTYLALSGYNVHYKNPEWIKNVPQALDFVQKLMDAPIDFICIENPISIISSRIRKPDQIIQPYQFGHSVQKSTCLWLKNLPRLKPTNVVDKGEFYEWIAKNGKKKKQTKWYSITKNRSEIRSKTFEGIANAIANQWGGLKKKNIPKKLF